MTSSSTYLQDQKILLEFKQEVEKFFGPVSRIGLSLDGMRIEFPDGTTLHLPPWGIKTRHSGVWSIVSRILSRSHHPGLEINVGDKGQSLTSKGVINFSDNESGK